MVNEMGRRYRSMDTKFSGFFGVQRLYIRMEKGDANGQPKQLSIMPDLLSVGGKRFGIKTSTHSDKLPFCP